MTDCVFSIRIFVLCGNCILRVALLGFGRAATAAFLAWRVADGRERLRRALVGRCQQRDQFRDGDRPYPAAGA